MLQRLHGRETYRTLYVPQPLSILDEDADEELLAILARDRGDYAHYGPGYFIDADAWWALEQRNNPMPYGLYAEKRRQDMEAYQAREEERREARREAYRRQREREQAEWPQREAEWRQRVDEINRRSDAFAEQARAHLRQEWVDMLQQAADGCRGTCYDTLVADLERDIATIRNWPPEQMPGHLDRARFNQELGRRKAWIDQMKEQADGTQTATL
jgi:hypothetical protein